MNFYRFIVIFKDGTQTKHVALNARQAERMAKAARKVKVKQVICSESMPLTY